MYQLAVKSIAYWEIPNCFKYIYLTAKFFRSVHVHLQIEILRIRDHLFSSLHFMLVFMIMFGGSVDFCFEFQIIFK